MYSVEFRAALRGKFGNCGTKRELRSRLQFAEVKDPVTDKLKRFGLLDQIGTDAFHPTIGAAVDAYLAKHAVDWKPWIRRRWMASRRSVRKRMWG
jgi:hypothetical protein